MIILYHGGGAGVTELLGPTLPSADWKKIAAAAKRLAKLRGGKRAAELWDEYEFELLEGTNYFGDEFAVLHASVDVEAYAYFSEAAANPASKASFRAVADAISEIGPFTRFVAVSLETEEAVIPVEPPSPRVTSEAVDRALKDAENLIQTSGASSAVDRVHTALHGYLRAVLDRRGVDFAKTAPITLLFSLLRENEPSVKDVGTRSEDLLRMIRAMSAVVDALNNIRNEASGAHPAEDVLAEAEAMLAINSTRTLLHYLDQKLDD